MVKLSKVDLRKSGDIRLAKIKIDLVKHGIKKVNLKKKKKFEFEITKILSSAVSSEYTRYILNQYDERSEQTFIDAVVANIMETSSWDEGYYNDDDIRLAIGRELMARLGIEVKSLNNKENIKIPLMSR